MPFVVYRSEAENRDLLSDVCGENLVNKDYRVKMQILIERLWGETYHKAYPISDKIVYLDKFSLITNT